MGLQRTRPDELLPIGQLVVDNFLRPLLHNACTSSRRCNGPGGVVGQYLAGMQPLDGLVLGETKVEPGNHLRERHLLSLIQRNDLAIASHPLRQRSSNDAHAVFVYHNLTAGADVRVGQYLSQRVLTQIHNFPWLSEKVGLADAGSGAPDHPAPGLIFHLLAFDVFGFAEFRLAIKGCRIFNKGGNDLRTMDALLPHFGNCRVGYALSCVVIDEVAVVVVSCRCHLGLALRIVFLGMLIGRSGVVEVESTADSTSTSASAIGSSCSRSGISSQHTGRNGAGRARIPPTDHHRGTTNLDVRHNILVVAQGG